MLTPSGYSLVANLRWSWSACNRITKGWQKL